MTDLIRQALDAARAELATLDARRARLVAGIASLSALVDEDHSPVQQEAPATMPRPPLQVSASMSNLLPKDDALAVLTVLRRLDGRPVKTSDLRRRLKWSTDRLSSRALRGLASTREVAVTGVTSGQARPVDHHVVWSGAMKQSPTDVLNDPRDVRFGGLRGSSLSAATVMGYSRRDE